MNTINHDGKVYQVGAVYEFSNDGKRWCVDTFEGIHQYVRHPYRTGFDISFKFIRACEVKVGTIEDAPIELIDGECYQFTDRYDIEWKGYFSTEHDTFYRARGWSDVNTCTNIKLLVVENS